MLIKILVLFIAGFCQLSAMHWGELGSLPSRGAMRCVTTAMMTKAPMLDAVRWSSTGSRPHKQIYTIPTYDAAFKWILDEDNVRLSFLHAFAAGVTIQSSKRIDENMNPVKGVQLLRKFLHQRRTLKTVRNLTSDCGPYKVIKGKNHLVHDDATVFLKKMAKHFYDIKQFFPKAPYDGTMDLVCKLDTGDYALVEMQVIPKNYWDRRALAYVASFYGNQLSRGRGWKDIKKVIGINILGGGKDDTAHWKDTPSEYVRHYKFEA